MRRLANARVPDVSQHYQLSLVLIHNCINRCVACCNLHKAQHSITDCTLLGLAFSDNKMTELVCFIWYIVKYLGWRSYSSEEHFREVIDKMSAVPYSMHQWAMGMHCCWNSSSCLYLHLHHCSPSSSPLLHLILTARYTGRCNEWNSRVATYHVSSLALIITSKW